VQCFAIARYTLTAYSRAEKNPRFSVDSWVLWGEAARRKTEITIQNVVKPYAMAANTEN
jgi:hypothetical protein